MRTQDVDLKTCQRIGKSGERGSGISVLAARHGDDDKGRQIKNISKVGDRSRGRPEGTLFDSYYTEV